MGLSELDYKLLQLVELAPTMSIQELAQRADTSWITAKKHIQHLRDIGVLSDPIAVFNPTRLGLKRYVIFFSTSNRGQMEQLEKACDIHPYTHYRVRIYGPYPGLFAQFDIPTAAVDNLADFLSELEKKGLCERFVIEPSSDYRTSTATNLDLFQTDTMSWDYDWNSWSKEISQTSSEFPDNKSNQSVEPSELNFTDLKILRELTSNANISQKKLQEKYSISQSTTSRRVIDIKERYIESIRAQIDRSRFNIVSTKLFYCANADDSGRNRLFNAFSLKSAPPFPLSIDLLAQGGVLLWGRMPPSHEHDLFYSLWPFLPHLQVFTMDTVGNHSCLYWFYHKNYNPKAKKWKTSREWVVDKPLQEIRDDSKEV